MNKLRFSVLVGATALSVGMAVLPGSAQAVQVDDPARVWIFGETYTQNQDGCAAPGLVTTLQFKVNGRWVDAAKSKSKKSRKCGGNYPYIQWFTFTVTELGTPIPGERESILQARLIWKANGKTWTRYFTKEVYRSKDDHAADLYDCLFNSASC